MDEKNKKTTADMIEEFREMATDLALGRRFPTITCPPLTIENKSKVVEMMISAGNLSIGKNASKASIMAELQKPEMRDLSIRETISTLTKKRLVTQPKKDATTKSNLD